MLNLSRGPRIARWSFGVGQIASVRAKATRAHRRSRGRAKENTSERRLRASGAAHFTQMQTNTSNLSQGSLMHICRTTGYRWATKGLTMVLTFDRRKAGRIVQDDTWPGMWRLDLGQGQLSDMLNLSRANS